MRAVEKGFLLRTRVEARRGDSNGDVALRQAKGLPCEEDHISDSKGTDVRNADSFPSIPVS